MPELIWWDVLADRASLRFAAIVAEEIAKHFEAKGNRGGWWAFISEYSRLSDQDASELRSYLASVKVLPEMSASLSDFLNLYPNCPVVKVLDFTPTGLPDVNYLLRFESRLSELEDKRSRSGVLVQAQAII